MAIGIPNTNQCMTKREKIHGRTELSFRDSEISGNIRRYSGHSSFCKLQRMLEMLGSHGYFLFVSF